MRVRGRTLVSHVLTTDRAGLPRSACTFVYWISESASGLVLGVQTASACLSSCGVTDARQRSVIAPGALRDL